MTTYDDNYGDIVPLPFTFSFFDSCYNNIIIGTNGNVTFNLANVNTYDPWPISGPLPGSNCTATEDCIMGPWNDLYPPNGGTIVYNTYGTAPNRKFVVSWNNVHLFISGTCSGSTTEQIVLYEGSNIVEIYIASRIACTAWNNGFAVTGIENTAGSTFYTPPGENGTTFTATNEGWRFTPTASPTPWTFTWYDSTRTRVITSADSITECPTHSTKYIVEATNPGACSPLYDTVTYIKTLVGVGIDSISYTNPSSCLYNTGVILFHGIPPGDTISVTYTYNGATRGPVTINANGDSDLVFSGLAPGVYNDFIFTHDSCVFGPYGPYVLSAPPIAISHETFTNPTVCGECDGSITLYGLVPSLPVSVNYKKNGVAQPAYVGTVGLDSTVHLNGLCAAAYTNIVATIGACSANGTPITLVNPAPIPASFYLTTKLACGGDVVTAYNTSTPAGYNAYWNWGDGSIDSSGAIPDTHQYKDSVLGYVATYTVTLTYESYHNPACATTHDTVISFNHPITAVFTEDNVAVCVGVPVNFTNTSIANGPSYLWDFGDGFTDTAKNPSHAYAVGGDYTVTLVTKDTIGCYSLPASGEVTAVQVDIHVSVADTSVCLTDSMHLHATPTVLPASEVSYYIYWSPTTNLGEDSSTTPNFFGIGTFTYTVNLATTSPAVCMASDNETVHSYPPVTLTGLTASPTIIPYGSSVMLNADGAVYYTWAPDNGTLSNPSINDPVATPTDTTTIYTVYGTNLYGCLDSAKITVNLDIDRLEDMPTGFTPDGDGLNDVFRITHLKYKKLVEFRVYNRWGQEVFNTGNPEIGWDGTYHGVPQDIGVYSYQIIIAESDGTQKVYKGSVTLIR
jgi:gliding motility-associated-like protein